MKNNLFARVGPKLQLSGSDKTRYPTLNIDDNGIELIDEPEHPRYTLRLNKNINSSVDSLTDLRSYSARGANSVVYLKGFSEPGDRGDGFFYWDSTSTSDEVGSIIVKVTGSATGRWTRIMSDGELNVCWFGAKGNGVNDDRPAIQEAIDYAIYRAPRIGQYSRIPTVFLPQGNFIISGTIHLGYGATESGQTYGSIKFQGAKRVNNPTFPEFQSTTITAVFTGSQPAINVQGLGEAEIRDLCLVGQYDYLSNKYVNHAGDQNISFWQDPTWPSSSWVGYAPYAGISIHGYSGDSPATLGYTAYPDVNYPSWFSSTPAQYNKIPGGGVRMENITIKRFCAGVGKWSNNQSNGEFITLINSSVNECIYGYCSTNSQQRNSKVEDCTFSNCFICINGGINLNNGTASPKLHGTYQNIHFAGCINIVSGVAGALGPLTFRDCYAESICRIGGFTGQGHPLTFDGCEFAFREKDTGSHFSSPKTHLYCPDGKIILKNSLFTLKHALVVDGGGTNGATIVLDGTHITSLTTSGSDYTHYKRSVQSTNGIILSDNGRVNIAGGVFTRQWPNTGIYTDNEQSENQFLSVWAQRTRFEPSLQASQFGCNFSLTNPSIAYTNYIGLTTTIVSRSNFECQIPRTAASYNWPIQLDVGDTIKIDSAVFIVKDISGSNAVLEQTTAFEYVSSSFTNLSNSDTPGAKIYFLSCGRVVKSRYPFGGTITAASNTITNVKIAADANQFAGGTSHYGTDVVTGSYLVLSDNEFLNIGGNSLSRINKFNSYSTGSQTMTMQNNYSVSKNVIFGFYILEDNP